MIEFGDFNSWRSVARRLAFESVSPDQVIWKYSSKIKATDHDVSSDPVPMFRISREFKEKAQQIFQSADETHREEIADHLYRVFFKILTDNRQLLKSLDDPLVIEFNRRWKSASIIKSKTEISKSHSSLKEVVMILHEESDSNLFHEALLHLDIQREEISVLYVSPDLRQILRGHRPKQIVVFGEAAARLLLDQKVKIADIRGRFIVTEFCKKTLFLVDPGAISKIRNSKMKAYERRNFMVEFNMIRTESSSIRR